VARIVVSVYMVRYPLGGMLSNFLQWLVGFDRLGHEVFAVEKAGWAGSCYDPRLDVMTDDCSYGFAAVGALLARFGLRDRLCYVDAGGRYHGLSRREVERAFAGADVFVDLGPHGAWGEEATGACVRVYVDGEPGAAQMAMEQSRRRNAALPEYDRYYSVGANVGTDASSAPTAGKTWAHVFHPVVADLFEPRVTNSAAAYSTVMNWQSHESLVYDGATYGQKDVEFEKFLDLPARTPLPLEVAVSGSDVPRSRLAEAGWRVRDAHAVTATYDTFVDYVTGSRGEFGVCKQVYVETRSGWFGDRSAVYLASGRPVVLEETGFSSHLPCGEGLFAVETVDDAAAAISEIERDYALHARRARELAREHLDAEHVLGRLLAEVGL
jgi:hypothetical protein